MVDEPGVCCLVGAQYGSEGKGTIAAALANDYAVHVRTGAPNAGHSIMWGGKVWKMRSVPCGWINPDALLIIGAGALIDVGTLIRETRSIEAAGYKIRHRLYVDHKAQVLLHDYHEFEGGTEGEAHRRIGSTGEGVGPARMAKIARGVVNEPPFNMYRPAGRDVDLCNEFVVCDTVPMLGAKSILLEGTQGSGLSLTHGLWPYCTSTDTNAAQLCADAGVPPMAVDRVILVARTFPIRVAGNSGPLQDETSWGDIGIEPEHTTVTNKVRRVGMWDTGLVERAIRLNGPTELALTFLDYVVPEADQARSWDDLPREAHEWIEWLERQVDVPVSMVGVGFDTDTVLRRPS